MDTHTHTYSLYFLHQLLENFSKTVVSLLLTDTFTCTHRHTNILGWKLAWHQSCHVGIRLGVVIMCQLQNYECKPSSSVNNNRLRPKQHSHSVPNVSWIRWCTSLIILRALPTRLSNLLPAQILIQPLHAKLLPEAKPYPNFNLSCKPKFLMIILVLILASKVIFLQHDPIVF